MYVLLAQSQIQTCLRPPSVCDGEAIYLDPWMANLMESEITNLLICVYMWKLKFCLHKANSWCKQISVS